MSDADDQLQFAIDKVRQQLIQKEEELRKAIEGNEEDIEQKVSDMQIAYNNADTLIRSDIGGLTSTQDSILNSIAALDSAYKAADAALWESIRQVEGKHDALEQESENTAKIYMIVNIVLGGVAVGLVGVLIVKAIRKKKSRQ